MDKFKNSICKKYKSQLTPRNFVAKNAQRTGAGSHDHKGYKRHEKHRNKEYV